jgi:hypothetical protein
MSRDAEINWYLLFPYDPLTPLCASMYNVKKEELTLRNTEEHGDPQRETGQFFITAVKS